MKTIKKAEHLLQFTELQAKLTNLMHYEYIQGNSNHVDVHIYNRLSAYIKDAFYSQIDISVLSLLFYLCYSLWTE